MRCFTAKRLIDPWLDKELKESRVNALLEHLKKCPGCSQEAQQSQRMNQLLRTDFDPELPAWVHNRILADVRSHETKRRTYNYRYRLQAIPASLAVLLSLYIGMQIGISTFGTNQTTEAQTEYVTFGENTLFAIDTSNGGVYE